MHSPWRCALDHHCFSETTLTLILSRAKEIVFIRVRVFATIKSAIESSASRDAFLVHGKRNTVSCKHWSFV